MPKYASKAKFLAPSGAQGVSLSVCLSVCPSGTSLSKALNLHLSLIVMSQICLRSVSGQSHVSTQGNLPVPVPFFYKRGVLKSVQELVEIKE